jgi:hypothetical protein
MAHSEIEQLAGPWKKYNFYRGFATHCVGCATQIVDCATLTYDCPTHYRLRYQICVQLE